MVAPGQRLVDGAPRSPLYDSTGVADRTRSPSPATSASAANQSTILVGDSEAAGTPISPTASSSSPRPAAPACFLSTGGFGPSTASAGAASPAAPRPVGDPCRASGVTPGQSITRSIAPRLLDPAGRRPTTRGQSDDDFAQTAPHAPQQHGDADRGRVRQHLDHQGAEEEGQGQDADDRVHGPRPTSNLLRMPASTTRRFAPCSSPHTTAKLSGGKHTFEVAAAGAGGATRRPRRRRSRSSSSHQPGRAGSALSAE